MMSARRPWSVVNGEVADDPAAVRCAMPVDPGTVEELSVQAGVGLPDIMDR